MRDTRIHFWTDYAFMGRSLAVIREDPIDRKRYALRLSEAEEVELFPGAPPPNGCVSRIPEGAAQELFDAMHAAGFRPSSQIDEASRAGAMESHLSDLRRIAFHALKIREQ